MPVFISHRTADDSIARTIAQRLINVHKIVCYVDDFDPLTRANQRITDLVLSRIASCTHILALVTDNTMGSWWVPFEIGVARQSERRIASYDDSTRALPEYLKEWPVLTGLSAIDTFAELYRRDDAAKLLLEKLENRRTSFAAVSSPDQFHRSLKAALGQL